MSLVGTKFTICSRCFHLELPCAAVQTWNLRSLLSWWEQFPWAQKTKQILAFAAKLESCHPRNLCLHWYQPTWVSTCLGSQASDSSSPEVPNYFQTSFQRANVFLATGPCLRQKYGESRRMYGLPSANNTSQWKITYFCPFFRVLPIKKSISSGCSIAIWLLEGTIYLSWQVHQLLTTVRSNKLQIRQKAMSIHYNVLKRCMISIDFPLPCSKNLFILGSPWLFNLGSSILRLLLHLQTSADSAFHAPNPQGVRDLVHLGKIAMFRVNLALIVKNSQWIIGRKWFKYPLFLVKSTFWCL